MSGEPELAGSASDEKVGFWGILGRLAGAVMVLGVLGIFGFIVRTELAHDEGRCPFQAAEVREVAQGVRVREEMRTCQDGVQERRWIILREGEEPREFARRRLDAELFAEDAYRWQLRTDDQGQLVLMVQNDGTRPIEVLEARLLDQ